MSLERIREYISYDPETGVFTWIKATSPKGGRNKAGKVAGSRRSAGKQKGRQTVYFMGRAYFAGPLAWFFVTGEMPPKGMMIDHADRDHSNDRFANLRLATRKQNQVNTDGRAARRASAFKGVYSINGGRYRKKWKAVIGDRYLGSFVSEQEAAHAYDAAAIVEHGSFARLNFPQEKAA